MDSSTGRPWTFGVGANNVRYRHGERLNILFIDGHVTSSDVINAVGAEVSGDWSLSEKSW